MGKKVKDQTFGFDRIFDDNAQQADVYEATTKPLLDSVLDGYNATVFAYGATGCGKTHTITGTVQQPGIIFLTMQELFERVSELSSEKVTEISLSYLEIYNETIRDLLTEDAVLKGGLMLREDSNQAVSVAGLSSHHPRNVEEVMDMIMRGNHMRTMSPTAANATSSRSHAVLQINVAQKDRNASVEEPHTMATLSIIDLAGSERASATKNRGERLLEGANINKSLLALGSCINALCDPRKRNHVPYRNSKLTRLLKFSLGGNCKTVMIVCVSPSSEHFDETQNTLRYANRAKNIQTKVTRNVYNVNRHVKDFLVKIDEQMALINELKAQAKDQESIAYAKFKKQNEKKEIAAREGITRIRNAFEHSAAERQERVNNMVKLRQISRRISTLSSWIAAFDTVCDMLEEEEPLHNLQAVRKTAQGIMIELESSRHHCQQKVNKSNWERSLNSALEFGLAQLKDFNTGDSLDASTLSREAELLKANAEREALATVAEQDKLGDAVTSQVLLQAHFETIAAINDMNRMSRDEAVEKATGILTRMLNSATNAVSHVVKPDGSLAPVEAFAPRKSGTPKRRKQYSVAEASPIRSFDPTPVAPQVNSTPVKASPRKRALIGSAKKGVQLSFTPKKRRSPVKGAKRAVRWRDDTDEGALAEYEKTPQKFTPSPIDEPSTVLLGAPQVSDMSSFAQRMEAADSPNSSPIPPAPEPSLIAHSKNDRFKAGFLSKKSEGSPHSTSVSIVPQVTIHSSSDTEQSPLREIQSNLDKRRSIPLSKPLEYSGADSPASGSDTENKDPDGLTSKAEAMKIRGAIKRSSSTRTSGISKTHRRRSPTAATASSPPGAGDMFGAGHVRRMVMAPPKTEAWKAGILSPRVDGVPGHHRSVSGGTRRTTFAGPSDNDRPGSGHSKGLSIGERAAVRLSSVNNNGREKENSGPGAGNVRSSLMPGKSAWR